MNQYPPKESEREQPPAVSDYPVARIAAVSVDSPAYDAGFEAGCAITSVDGFPVRDIIDWRWLSSSEEIEVGYLDLDGEEGTVVLWRDYGEDWGFEFEGLVFDRVKQCRNACTFCFMHQLPKGMRRSLYLRDDDFRLSFLVGTFVTFTNLSAQDEQRIVEQHISPLRVSLQASSPEVRSRLIGKHAAHGLAVLERLLDAGIQVHAQVVLVPGENDGDELRRTLEWAYARPGVLNVGIVPLGFTRHQSTFTRSFNDAASAQAVLQLIRPFQERALSQRGHAWVFAADEFYRNAYGSDVMSELPPTSHYGDFSLFEDGIGIIRSTIDEWGQAEESGLLGACGRALRQNRKRLHLVAGYAQAEFLSTLVERHGLADVMFPFYIENLFFGGNVDVTGLLTGQDIVRAVRRAHIGSAGAGDLVCIPRVIFNDDGLTLDDMTLQDMRERAGVRLHVVSCSPLDYFPEIAELASRPEED